jgi:CobQ-like glutamine amidotransferase family enzyme
VARAAMEATEAELEGVEATMAVTRSGLARCNSMGMLGELYRQTHRPRQGKIFLLHLRWLQART